MFAVIDVETTGLRPARDRIIEIAVVRVDEEQQVRDEWCTLVNPNRSVGATSVHGITRGQIRDAPTFGEVAGDILSRLQDAVLVAHNARFDSAFVCAEFKRLGQDLSSCEWMCTLDLATRLGFGTGRALRDCCDNLGIAYEGAHTALVDAQLTAHVLAFLMAAAYDRRLRTSVPAAFVGSGVSAAQGCGRVRVRSDSRPPAEPPLRRLVNSHAATASPGGADPAAVGAYTALLDEVLADRLVTPDEAKALCELAVTWGLTAAQLPAIHGGYMADLAAAAAADKRLSRQEHEDLGKLADLLGVDRSVILAELTDLLA